MLKKHIWTAADRVKLIEEGKQNLIIDQPAPFVKRITINAPQVRNALSNETRAALFDQLQLNDQDPDCRVTIIRGSNGTFCTGYDIAEKKTALPFFTDESDGQQPRNNLAGWFMINDLSKPVIASVEGECLGGGEELAAACDIVLVADDAVIGYPIVRGQGLPDYQIYPWLMGHRNAMEIMLTNRQMGGEESVDRGWATAHYPAQELEQKSIEFATRVAKIPADLLAFNKRSVHRAFETMGIRTNLRNGVDLEALMFKAPGAKMLTARRGPAKAGEAREPPPRPTQQHEQQKSPSSPINRPAPPSKLPVQGPAVGASMVSANSVTPTNKTSSQLLSPPPPLTSSSANKGGGRPATTSANTPTTPMNTTQVNTKTPTLPAAATTTPKKSPSTPVNTTSSKATPPQKIATKTATPINKPIQVTSSTKPVVAAPKSVSSSNQTPSKNDQTTGEIHLHLHEAVNIHIHNGDDKPKSKL